jgi:hypothetical protein
VYAVFLFLAAVGGALGAWGGAYLAERGKRYATKEDFENILREQQRTTMATEAIKTEIAGGLWLEQRRWDQRRELYWALLRSLDITARACSDYIPVYEQTEKMSASDDKSGEANQRYQQAYKALGAALTDLQSAGTLAAIILPPDVSDALARADEKFANLVLSERALTKNAVEILGVSLRQTHKQLIEIARKDLGMPLVQYPEARKQGG